MLLSSELDVQYSLRCLPLSITHLMMFHIAYGELCVMLVLPTALSLILVPLKGQHQSQVMSPNAPIIPVIMTAAAAQLRLQQMLQIQAPADIIRMLHAGHEVNAEAKTVRDVQNNVHRVASEFRARTA